MKVRLLPIALVLACLPFQAAIAKTDPMCSPLRKFVESVQPNETRAIEFRTSWGGNFKDDPEPVIFAKRCNNYGYAPAEALCAYLVEYGATEFSHDNLKRALMCLSEKTAIDQGVSFLSAVISVDYGTDSRGSVVKLEFSDDPQIGGMVLKVAADGY